MKAAVFLLMISMPLGLTPAAAAQDAAKNVQTSAATAKTLTDSDVLALVESRLAPEVIVEKIKASECDFDTSPEALRKLKDAGVPDSLLLVMVMTPKCAASAEATQARRDGAKVATQMAITGVLLWPIAPVVLLHGFKRGENALVPEGKRFNVVVRVGASVNAPARQ